MAKNAAKTETAPSESPDISSVLDAAETGTPIAAGASAVSASGKATDILAKLKKKGAKSKNIGGSLPTIEFGSVGDAVLVRYKGRKSVESKTTRKGDKTTFDVLAFEVIDVDTFDPENGACGVLGHGAIVEAATLAEPMEKVSVDDIVLITYHGKGKAAHGHPPPHLYAVDLVWSASA